MGMFCYQCEQTANGTGCTNAGVCGKLPDTAALQDELIEAVYEISWFAHRAARLGRTDRDIDVFVIEALFSTVTNVNFDPERVLGLIRKARQIKARAQMIYQEGATRTGQDAETPPEELCAAPRATLDEITNGPVAIVSRRERQGDDVTGLQELILYGLKGAAAYADHALLLGREDAGLYAGFHEVLEFLAGRPAELEALLAMALRVGELNLKAMELLDAANTGAYGHPEPTAARVTALAGHCILVSGHDLKDLEEILIQTQGKGIHVYTHGEMLPALAYPGLKKHPHLAGHYGGAWQDQQKEFAAFPGAIVMTTNCIQKPMNGYKDRLFTSGLVAWPGVRHIHGRDFTPAIEAALKTPGFAETAPEKTITIGFARNAVLSRADAVLKTVREGKVRHIFLVGGCDGAKPGRNYYTELATRIPQDCLILTLACGKFRFNRLDFGAIDGIPRLLDAGQCNDAYSAVQVAVGLANALGCGVNDLPLSLILSWYEQKAVAILLTLLHLGVRGIRLGPSLPAFLTPAALKELARRFDIKPVTTPEADLKAILNA